MIGQDGPFPFSDLESAIFPKEYDSFKLEIIYRNSSVGPKAAHCSWVGHYFQNFSEDRAKKYVFFKN